MDSFIRAVQQLEDSNPDLSPLALLRALRRTAGHDDAMTIHFLGSSNNLSDTEGLEAAILNASSFSFFDKAIHHIVTDNGEERGVVLAQDGTTVALGPLLLGIEAGLKARVEGKPSDGIFSLTLGRTLGLSFLSLQDLPPSNRLGPNGCWDSVHRPKMFKLSQPATLATDAMINGGMDGAILGVDISDLNSSEEPKSLSKILKDYYSFILQEEHDLDTLTRHVSQKRRESSRALLESRDLHGEVMKTLALVWKLEKTEWIAFDNEIGKSVEDGLHEFVHNYWGEMFCLQCHFLLNLNGNNQRTAQSSARQLRVSSDLQLVFALLSLDCPPIIPRCQWGANAHESTPTPLSLPLQFLYVHHTYEPSAPCLSFTQCSRDMKAMQRFHQEDRGWGDIGYRYCSAISKTLFDIEVEA